MESTMSNQNVILLLLLVIVTDNSWAWHLEARPSLKYTTLGGSPTITCYNVTSTRALPRNSRWYKIASNGALQQLPTDTNERVRNDGSQLRISSARDEDNGTYCCKGPTQALDTCDETATTHLIVVVSPVITPGRNQTAHVGRNAIVECIIENGGNPRFVVFRWQKSEQRLLTDGTKYSSELIGNNTMVLTIHNSTTDDEGYYQCILETPVFQRREASVYLSVNDSITHMGSNDVPLSDTDYALWLYGQVEISVGMNLTIQCTVVTSAGSPIETNDIQLSLILPTGEVIIEREFSTVATLEHSGIYSCIAYFNGALTIVSLSVIVYVAPQPTFHSNSVSASYGSDVILPCTVYSANPSPAYNWEKLSVEDASSEISGRTLSDGSLLLQNVQKPGMYQCTAHNIYGSSTQITELRVEMSTPTKQQSLDLVGAHLRSSCDQIEHRIKLSSLLEQYITNICNYGDITVTTNVTRCTDDSESVKYNIQLTGIMATEATLLLVTNMQNLTEGLDLGIVVLFLQERGNSLESHCNDQSNAFPSGIFGIIAVLTVIITIMLIFVLIYVAYFRKRLTKESQKFDIETVNATYVTANPRPPIYNRLHHSNKVPPVVPIRRSNSENSLTGYMKVYPKCHQNNHIKPYLQLPSPSNQTTDSVAVLHNPTTSSSTNNNNQSSIRGKIGNCDMDVIPSTTYPSYVCIKNNKI